MIFSEFQQKRAENIIWNCAEDYSFVPDLRAYDSNGNADVYFNCIIGAVRKHYDYKILERILCALQQYENSEIYEGLFWIGLENCTFLRERPFRPVLETLRIEYAKRFIAQFPDCNVASLSNNCRLLDALSLAHWQRVLGEDPKLSGYDISLLNELEFSSDLSAEDIAAISEKLFLKWFNIITREKKKLQPHTFLRFSINGKRRMQHEKYRRFGAGFVFHPEGIYGGESTEGEQEKAELNSRLTEVELRSFMETKYGRPVFPPHTVAKIERELCCGNHNNCNLLFTDGVKVSAAEIQNGFEALSRQREAAQIEANKQFYRSNIIRNKLEIFKLSDSIRNSVLLHLQPSPVKSDSGIFNPGVAWRAKELNDTSVFIRQENDNMGNISVDILLDASTSQKSRQEIISSQGMIICESLTSCGIPCRVMSFCSMTGYTILRIFREYNMPQDNSKILEYVSNGCNRDGLAIRAAHSLMRDTGYEHKILIVLSDVKPNDVVRIKKSAETDFVPYDSDAGLEDTAIEVRRARADGISVICIFTGEDSEISSAKTVYDRDFVRIRGFDVLADTVGRLIQNQIKNL